LWFASRRPWIPWRVISHINRPQLWITSGKASGAAGHGLVDEPPHPSSSRACGNSRAESTHKGSPRIYKYFQILTEYSPLSTTPTPPARSLNFHPKDPETGGPIFGSGSPLRVDWRTAHDPG